MSSPRMLCFLVLGAQALGLPHRIPFCSASAHKESLCLKTPLEKAIRRRTSERLRSLRTLNSGEMRSLDPPFCQQLILRGDASDQKEFLPGAYRSHSLPGLRRSWADGVSR